MSRRALIAVTKDAGFPRVSGDEPATGVRPLGRIVFSPRERG